MKNVSRHTSRTFLGLPKLPARYASLVVPLLLSVFMTCIVSLISTFKGIGADPHFMRVWLGAWLISWAVAFPTLLLVLPVVRKVTAALVEMT
ncbi:DUF2798 domain-containing protein [Montanilutibacter psychrotolerans]|uniref:DUF2798 domain-containing protein n=1 Tax=Montanilutibacter psychrotolerans TaxID=1327343 RepID=A0A3M8SPK9_9GAMM|nr:DUF2798 domain-containing protein [Lysobacter psychrotolerans]RNF83241.1 DUF2798 domain-containing protein [Lysobacter psychrotolerans]